FLPEKIDRSLVQYLQDAGFLGEVVYMSGLKDIIDYAACSGRKIYAIDDYGAYNDAHCVNSIRDMEIVNSKEWVNRLSNYAPQDISVSIDELNDDHFQKFHVPGRNVFLKTCNTEAAGSGVFPVASLEEFNAARQQIKEH